MSDNREILENFLKDLGIDFNVVTHPEVFTVEAMMPHLHEVEGLVCKNLFLKDKKKKKLWLVTASHNQTVNLSWLAKELKLSGLRFADENILLEKLKVGQGCVTPLALMFDKDLDVNFILDKALTLSDEARIYSHPMVNNASLGLLYSDFRKFVEQTKHEMIIVDFSK